MAKSRIVACANPFEAVQRELLVVRAELEKCEKKRATLYSAVLAAVEWLSDRATWTPCQCDPNVLLQTMLEAVKDNDQ